MRVLIAGGGTGGHLFPGIALAQELRRRDPSAAILFVGTARGIEARAVPRAGFELALLSVRGLRRKGAIDTLRGAARLPVALWQAMRVVRRFRPDVAVSVGGYAAGPAVLAAKLLRVPCLVMEQNAVPGVTNRLLARLATRIIAGLPTPLLPAHKTLVLGNPVRAEMLAVRAQPYAPATPMRLLIFGGSQGARAINEAMMAAAPVLAAHNLPLRIVHQTGQGDVERVQRAYAVAGLREASVCAFIDDMAAAYAKADVVLCRAGATTIAELTVCGRPAVFVPYPFAVDDHQSANAQVVADHGAAVVLPQAQLTTEILIALLQQLIDNPAQRVRMAQAAQRMGRPEAVVQIADTLEDIVNRKRQPKRLAPKSEKHNGVMHVS